MTVRRDMLPPYGVPLEPQLPADGLIRHFLAGGDTGSSSDSYIQRQLLVCNLAPLAIRLPEAILLRADIPADVEGMRGAVIAALERQGWRLVEEDPPLAQVVGVEAAGLRAAYWSLWGRDADAAREALERAAAAEYGEDVLMPDAAEGARIEDILQEMERDLEAPD